MTFNTEQERTVYFRAKDEAGNFSEVKTATIKIDKSAPSIVVNKTVDGNGEDDWTNTKVTFNISAQDVYAGVDKIQYRLNGGTWTDVPNSTVSGKNATASIEFTDEQSSIVRFRAIDKVVNNGPLSKESSNYDIKIDKTSPTVEVTRTPEEWTCNDVTIIITAKDENGTVKSGISTSAGKFVYDGQNVSDFTVRTKVNDANIVVEGTILEDYNGSYTITIKDRAGNTGTATHVVTNIDKIPGQIRIISDLHEPSIFD